MKSNKKEEAEDETLAALSLKATPFVKVKEPETGVKRPSTTPVKDKVPTYEKLEDLDRTGAESSEPEYVK